MHLGFWIPDHFGQPSCFLVQGRFCRERIARNGACRTEIQFVVLDSVPWKIDRQNLRSALGFGQERPLQLGAAVGLLLENLSQLLKSNVDLICGAKEELELLSRDVALLEKAAAKHEEEADITSLVYEVVDAIDTWLSTRLAARKDGAKNLSLHLEPKLVDNQLTRVVRSLREDKLKPMLDKVTRVDFDHMRIGDRERPRTKVRKVSSMRLQERGNVGLQDEEYKLISCLTEETEQLDAITIVGMPGLGKTALAWRIYHNQKIQYAFPTRIWVEVSQSFNMKDMLLDILKQLTSQDTSNLSAQELVISVRAHFEKGKFLLVMDDVWTIEAWNAISAVLPFGNRMSKVLITSRDKRVGSHANCYREPYLLRFLRFEESCILLQRQVFGTVGECPPELQDIVKYIAKQCEGLPLLIVLIGGILLDQLGAFERNMDGTRRAWINVADNISTFTRSPWEISPLSDVVKLSYSILPDELKDCFLYLGVFPEDYEIPAWTLTRLWIAEGFIQPKQGQGLEEGAEDNLEELSARNLVTVGKRKCNGQVKTCRVHDIIRAFCCSKAASREQNLFQEVKKFEYGFSDILKCRRLCIHSNPEEFLSGKPKGPCIRSLLCFNKEPDYLLNPKYISAIPDGFKLLRVLESNKSFKYHQFPKGVTKLIHLKYITLSGDNLHVLPAAMSELWNLQTIVVDTKSRQLTVKANIWNMVLLRHLKTKAAMILDIKVEEECHQAGDQNLQTLTRLSPDYCTENVFRRARNLKTLGIFGKLSSLMDAKSLQKLKCLEKLKLVNDLFYESASEHSTPISIQLNCFPPNLKMLTLSATFLDWEYMSKVLAKIEPLEILKLKDNAFSGRVWNADGGFRSLRFLLIAETDLVSWEASAEHFPMLECLVLKNCQELREIPVGLAKSLQKLDIERLGKSAVESARKIDEEKRRSGISGGGFNLAVGPGCAY